MVHFESNEQIYKDGYDRHIDAIVKQIELGDNSSDYTIEYESLEEANYYLRRFRDEQFDVSMNGTTIKVEIPQLDPESLSLLDFIEPSQQYEQSSPSFDYLLELIDETCIELSQLPFWNQLSFDPSNVKKDLMITVEILNKFADIKLTDSIASRWWTFLNKYPFESLVGLILGSSSSIGSEKTVMDYAIPVPQNIYGSDSNIFFNIVNVFSLLPRRLNHHKTILNTHRNSVEGTKVELVVRNALIELFRDIRNIVDSQNDTTVISLWKKWCIGTVDDMSARIIRSQKPGSHSFNYHNSFSHSSNYSHPFSNISNYSRSDSYNHYPPRPRYVRDDSEIVPLTRKEPSLRVRDDTTFNLENDESSDDLGESQPAPYSFRSEKISERISEVNSRPNRMGNHTISDYWKYNNDPHSLDIDDSISNNGDPDNFGPELDAPTYF